VRAPLLVERSRVLAAVNTLLPAELAAKGGAFLMAAVQAGGEEQVLDAVNTLLPAELAAKAGHYMAAVRQAGGEEQVLAAATTLSLAKLAVKSHEYLVAMASASAGVDVPGHIYTSTEQVLAAYIMQIRQIRPEELRLAKQRGEMQLLLLAQIAQRGADPSGTTGEGIGPAGLSSGRVLLLQLPLHCRKRTRLQRDGTGGGADAS
jgi:hypothetical protein